MKLKSGCMFWPQVDPAAPILRDVDRDLYCDLAIIGGGITGALAAHFLSRESISVILLDRRGIAAGSTVASTGLLQYELDVTLTHLRQKLGEDHANQAYLASLEAVRAFPELITTLPDNCALTPRPSLYLACDESDIAELEAEYRARRQINIPVEFLTSHELKTRFAITRPAALLSSDAFEVDPYRLTTTLITDALHHGLQAYRCEVTQYEPHSSGVSLQTSSGPSIDARHILFATGYETPQFLPRDICQLRTTYALVTQPLESFWPSRCLIWESGNPYFYLRTTPDGRAMLGGEDEDLIARPGPDPLIPAKTQALCDKFRALFPKIPTLPSCVWSGTFAQTADGLPYIGSIPEFPHGLFALGYGGNGITFSLLAAQILRDHLLGRENRYSGLFTFNR